MYLPIYSHVNIDSYSRFGHIIIYVQGDSLLQLQCLHNLKIFTGNKLTTVLLNIVFSVGIPYSVINNIVVFLHGGCDSWTHCIPK